MAQLTAYCLSSVPCLTRTRDAHAHGRPRPSVRDRALQASKRTSPPSMSTTASQAKSMTAQVCQAWRRESRSSGTSGRERGVLRDATVAIPSPAAGRLRLPHPATARNLPSAADLRLAELCLHLRRGLSSIRTRGDAACRKCSRRRQREGTRWTEWLRGHERARRAIAALTARGGR